jgi:ubiquinone biosynthesis protein
MKTQIGVQVCGVYPEFSSTKVLTMEFVRGVKITNAQAINAAGIDRENLGQRFMRAFLKQVMVDGFFHGDPHPGNLLVDTTNGTLTFIDLGLVGVLDGTKRLDLIDLVLSLYQKDAASIADVLLRLSRRLRPVNLTAYRSDMENLVHQYVIYSSGSTLSAVMSRLFGLLQVHGLRLDRQLTLALKAISQCEETMLALGTKFDVVAFANDQLGGFAAEAFTQDKIIEAVKQQVMVAGKQLVRRIPSLSDATNMWLDQYMSGRFTVHLDTSDLGQHVESFGNSAQRLTAGLVITGIIVGTAIVAGQLVTLSSPATTWLPILVIGVFVIMVVLGIIVIWNSLRLDKRTR